PVPFVVIDGVVVDPVGSAERLPAVGAAHEHHVGSGVEAGRLHARQHVNIVISAAARTVHRQEKLPGQSGRVYQVAEIQVTAKIDGGGLVETRCDATVFGI